MKKFVSVTIVILTVLLVVLIAQISDLRDDVSGLRGELDREVQSMNSNISNIYDDVHDMLEEEANQLAVCDWEYGQINVEHRTAEVIFTMVPKVHTPNETQASIMTETDTWELSYADGQYSAVVGIPLFDRTEFTMVRLDDNGTIRTQSLHWVIEPRYEALLRSYAGLYGSWSTSRASDLTEWMLQGLVNVDIERKGEFQVKSVELVELLDEKEINRIPVDLSKEGQQNYTDAARENDVVIPSAEPDKNEQTGSGYDGHASFCYYLDKTYSIPDGSILELYVDVVDGNGLRYRSFVECYATTADGEPDDLRMEEKQLYTFAEPVMIFDADGTVIYEIEPDKFQ